MKQLPLLAAIAQLLCMPCAVYTMESATDLEDYFKDQQSVVRVFTQNGNVFNVDKKTLLGSITLKTMIENSQYSSNQKIHVPIISDIWQTYIAPELRTPGKLRLYEKKITDLVDITNAAHYLEMPQLLKAGSLEIVNYITDNIYSIEKDDSLLKLCAKLNKDVAKEYIATCFGFIARKATYKDHTTRIKALTLNRSGTRLASCSKGKLIIQELPSGKIYVECKIPDENMDYILNFVTDDTLAIATGRSFTLLDIKGASKTLYKNDRITCCATNPQGTHIALCTEWDNNIYLSKDGTLSDSAITLPGHTKKIVSVTFSSDGTLLVSSSTDNSVKIWDIETLTLRASLQPFLDTSHVVALSNDNKLLAAACGENIVLYDISDAHNEPKRITSMRGHLLWVTSLTFSPNNKWLISASYDGTVILWHVPSGAIYTKIEGLQPRAREMKPYVKTFYDQDVELIQGALISPDSKTIYSHTETKISVWDIDVPPLSLAKTILVAYLQLQKRVYFEYTITEILEEIVKSQQLQKMYEQCTDEEKKMIDQILDRDD